MEVHRNYDLKPNEMATSFIEQPALSVCLLNTTNSVFHLYFSAILSSILVPKTTFINPLFDVGTACS